MANEDLILAQKLSSMNFDDLKAALAKDLAQPPSVDIDISKGFKYKRAFDSDNISSTATEFDDSNSIPPKCDDLSSSNSVSDDSKANQKQGDDKTKDEKKEKKRKDKTVLSDRDLRHLGKRDLIEIIYELKKIEEELNSQVADLSAKIEDRQIKLNEAGSIAEAAISVSNIFSVAQSAADEYLSAIQNSTENADKIVAEAEEKAKSIVDSANGEAQTIVFEAELQAKSKIKETEKYCEDSLKDFEQLMREKLVLTEQSCQKKIDEADLVIAERWKTFNDNVQKVIAAQKELRQFTNS